MSFQTQYVIPNGDLITYLQGTWKRSLEWRHFGGGYQHLRTSNTIISIEEHVQEEGDIDESRLMKWCFGSSLGPEVNDMAFGYLMKFIPDTRGTFMDWEHSGVRCHGHFDPTTGVATLNFNLKDSTVTATYRLMDENTMAVALIEVGQTLVPTIQYGNMYRVNPTTPGT
jgi:hypothetical protein|tara:strand:+ start:26 stop:532 length:507 start_codon:yes stop_codon:yes gene_type:complete